MKQLEELHHSKLDLEEFNRRIISDYAAIETTNLLCIVTENYLYELFVFYASVKRAWHFFPWKIYAFSPERATVSRINDLKLANLEAAHLPFSEGGGWANNAALKVELVGKSGIEKGVVSDLDNIFVEETPELQLLLSSYDYVFIGAPHSKWIVQTSLWGFRNTPSAVSFAKRWAKESEGRPFADASGFPFALKDNEDPNLSVIVLAKQIEDGAPHHQCPYDVQANISPFELNRDCLGYFERHMGRAKVIHFGGLRSEGNDSVEARMDVMNRKFKSSRPVFPLYLECANEAADIMGMSRYAPPKKLIDNIKSLFSRSY